MRIKSPGDDQELGIELIQFYLNKDLGGVISPATLMNHAHLWKVPRTENSKDPDDQELARCWYQEEIRSGWNSIFR